jgi:hypothetical protein
MEFVKSEVLFIVLNMTARYETYHTRRERKGMARQKSEQASNKKDRTHVLLSKFNQDAANKFDEIPHKHFLID